MVSCPSKEKGLELVTWTELDRSPLNNPSSQGITVSQLSSTSVPGIVRFRSALSAACWTETAPLSACFSRRSRSWCMTPSCSIRVQLPSEERGKPNQVWERSTVIEIHHAAGGLEKPVPFLSWGDGDCSFCIVFYNLQLSRGKWAPATGQLMWDSWQL